jgi:23S rRNA pseudouridine1911/1915/1917 synthase
MVHRLDKQTSGILVWAKTAPALTNLLGQFKERQIIKKYRCLVHGRWYQGEGRINLPLARRRTNRQMMAVDPRGREAITCYRVVKCWAGIDAQRLIRENGEIKAKEIARIYQGFSEVEAIPKTGRTHQIRVHLAHSHHPLVGDEAYVSKAKIRLDKKWCVRQFLHAGELTLVHPRTRGKMTFTSPLPADLKQALTFLLS